ncbi:Capsular polysaccharide biosynthesis protein [Aneurinibacillus thermoaerophilus]|jgi:capsular polysaccharide biosynthesis protein|uniref:Capsular biosynthesis protein n=1 Tax=Aneurinibacillus thermoaerophilus TaxID=143495 RepID=A0A1G7ZZH0_ANETH|nr:MULTISPECIES: Wzz/FepE/Etk N-terminal domain-containing protein [Aneurinibacillus]AMA71667.1 hypothetical protein ACH33_01655 [Aneurinibacillus sp. XH2]MED0680784.1 Wzz/FepE/Etk N-terminal domain-containing protein [Aneurinibacillus thermoaerophilus]MED0763894.1 Wzz/FepE/Etk N-terminal domain-containing protein [Aneurinibacillus thermoaerophilus]QYY42578.1 capsular biosynthesis protein [Aneurinibacillus thermoaerophilus]SDH13967.1 Capsular polysaccharide biosynthesis protein [Aneurinibacill
MSLQEETLNIREMVTILRKRLWMVVLITLGVVGVSAGVTKFLMTPVYEAKTELLVNKSQDGDKTGIISMSEIESNLQLIETYSVIIKSPRIMEIVAQKLGEPDKVASLTEQIKVSAVKNSQIISIVAEDTNQRRAALIANTVAQTFNSEIVKLMKVDNVQVLTKAKADERATPVKPKLLVNVAIALAISSMLSVGLAFLLEYMDNTLKTEEDVEKHLGLPVLGTIAVIDAKNGAKHTRLKEEKKVRMAAAGENR